MVHNYKDSHRVACSGELGLKTGVARGLTQELAVFHPHPFICLTSIICRPVSTISLLDYYSMYNLEGWNDYVETQSIAC